MESCAGRAESEGRSIVISPFPATQKRTTAKTAEERNRYIIGRADSVLVAHASAGGKTEELAQAVVEGGKRRFTLRSQLSQWAR
jgi:predicted Rossmann fold nucleotide-binding protein DprA/Smf involved in DNA uptake